MRLAAACFVALAAVAHAFYSAVGTQASHATRLYGYVPDGLSKEQYDKMKKEEAAKARKREFGKAGARGFESRSMQSFVKALENGEAKHLMPVNPKKVKSGEIALKDVPYMQRGGSWDNSDLRAKNKGWMNTGFGMRAFNDGKAQKMKENKYDKKYNNMKPSTNIWGTQVGTDWTGKQAAQTSARAKKNGISNDQQMWRDAGALSPAEIRKRGKADKIGGVKNEPEKKFFGLF